MKIVYYVLIDLIIVAGVLLSIFVVKDLSVLPLLLFTLLVNLMHQTYGEEKYFNGMFDQGRPFLVKYSWPFLRWLLTLISIGLVIAAILDSIAK